MSKVQQHIPKAIKEHPAIADIILANVGGRKTGKFVRHLSLQLSALWLQ